MINPIQFRTVIDKLNALSKDDFSYYTLQITPDEKLNTKLSLFFSGVFGENSWSIKGDRASHLIFVLAKLTNNELEKYFDYGQDLTAKPETLKLLFCAVNQKYPNLTSIDTDGNLIFKPAIDEKIIERAITAVRWYNRGQIKGVEGVVVKTGDDGSGLKIARLRYLFLFHFVYKLNEQVTLHNVLDSKNGVVIIAKIFKWSWTKYHVFVAPYNEDLELHGPFTLLGAIK